MDPISGATPCTPSARQPALVQCLAGRQAECLERTEDVALVGLQFLTEVLHDEVTHHLGVVRWSSHSISLQRRRLLVLINANSFAQIRILPEEGEQLGGIVQRLARGIPESPIVQALKDFRLSSD